MTEIDLDRRAQEILGAVVEEYVAAGEPVGSRTLSRKDGRHLSPATIRNTMADLEERGLLEQPHASAGRIPTELGYRVYVDNLMRERQIAPADERFIHEALGRPRAETAGMFAQVSKVLSTLSHQIGVVVTPNVARVRLRHIEFVALAPRRIVAIVVEETGVIHNKVFETEEDYAQDQLDRAGRWITDAFQGLTLTEARDRILAMLSEEKALCDRLVRDALTLGRASVGAEPGSGESAQVFVEGTANILGTPEFADAERLRPLLRTFEERHDLLQILNRCLEEGQGRVQILIGSETKVPDLTHCTLITSAYGPEGAALGALGVIGPTRMEYAKAVALVDYVSRFFGRLLSRYTA